MLSLYMIGVTIFDYNKRLILLFVIPLSGGLNIQWFLKNCYWWSINVLRVALHHLRYLRNLHFKMAAISKTDLIKTRQYSIGRKQSNSSNQTYTHFFQTVKKFANKSWYSFLGILGVSGIVALIDVCRLGYQTTKFLGFIQKSCCHNLFMHAFM